MVAASEVEIPTATPRTGDISSGETEAPRRRSLSTLPSYEGLDWQRVQGYGVPTDDRKTTSYIFKHGWRLESMKDGSYYWLCKLCYKSKRRGGLYNVSKATSTAGEHLKAIHFIGPDGEIQQSSKKRKLMDLYVNGVDAVSQLKNERACQFEYNEFQALFYSWFVSSNLSFRTVDSKSFRTLLEYLNPRCLRYIPSSTTVSRTLVTLHDKQLGLLTEQLLSAVTRINISFDLWTSGNQLALLGIVTHYIDVSGTPKTLLLSLPRQHGKHSGLNLAETIGASIAE